MQHHKHTTREWRFRHILNCVMDWVGIIIKGGKMRPTICMEISFWLAAQFTFSVSTLLDNSLGTRCKSNPPLSCAGTFCTNQKDGFVFKLAEWDRWNLFSTWNTSHSERFINWTYLQALCQDLSVEIAYKCLVHCHWLSVSLITCLIKWLLVFNSLDIHNISTIY